MNSATRREVLRLGAIVPWVVSCDSFGFERRIARLRSAARGESPERIVAGKLRATSPTNRGELIAVSGTTTVSWNRNSRTGTTHYHVESVLQRPAAIEAETMTILAAAISWIWLLALGSVASVSLIQAKRVNDPAEMSGPRLWSFREGDVIQAYGTVESRPSGRGFFADAELVVGDLNALLGAG